MCHERSNKAHLAKFFLGQSYASIKKTPIFYKMKYDLKGYIGSVLCFREVASEVREKKGKGERKLKFHSRMKNPGPTTVLFQ